MTESANSPKRQRTLLAIHRSALRLADEHGLDGFTMDQLAEEVGVSRRTLFNYVPSKMDAVLGPEPELEPALLEEFIAGGPTGHLLSDLRTLAVAFLVDSNADQEDLARFRRLLHGDARVLQAAHQRFEGSMDDKLDFLRQREGADFPEEQARLVFGVLAVVFNLALNAFLDDTGTPLPVHYSRIFDQLTELV